MLHVAAGKGGAFIGGPTGPLLPFSNLDQFKDRPTFTRTPSTMLLS